MRWAIGVGVLWCVLCVAIDARADARCPRGATHCLDHVPAFLVRAHAGAGALLDGGMVGPRSDFEHARALGMLAIDLGARPFGGGAVIGLLVGAQLADGALIGAFGVSLEYDLAYLTDRSPNRDVDVVIGGALAIDCAHSWASAAAGVTSNYDLVRPDWRAYFELRVRAGVRDQVLVHAQVVTGFDDLAALSSLTLSGGYAFQAY